MVRTESLSADSEEAVGMLDCTRLLERCHQLLTYSEKVSLFWSKVRFSTVIQVRFLTCIGAVSHKTETGGVISK